MLAALSPSARRQASPARGAARIYRVMAKWHLLSKRVARAEWSKLEGSVPARCVSYGRSVQNACSSLDGWITSSPCCGRVAGLPLGTSDSRSHTARENVQKVSAAADLR